MGSTKNYNFHLFFLSFFHFVLIFYHSNSAADIRKLSQEEQAGIESNNTESMCDNRCKDNDVFAFTVCVNNFNKKNMRCLITGDQDIHDQVRQNVDNSDEEFEEFRPRLRSRSLDEYRSQARQNVLENLHRNVRLNHESSKPRENRRKSFEVWLTEKEHENIRQLQMLALKRQRQAEEDAKRKEQRKGKTYEEWLSEKNNMAAMKDENSEEEQQEIMKEERQQTSKRRYEKWLMEKEAKALEKEKEMLKEAKLKTIEMRKKYEEKKKNKLRFLKSSHF